MIATIVNCLTVILGSLTGLFIRKHIREDLKTVVYKSSGMISLVIGMQMALKSENALYLIVALVLGGMLGYAARLETRIYNLGGLLEKRFGGGEKTFAAGFLNASVLFCVGAMTIVGAIRAGTARDYDLILTKSVMDGFMAIFLTSALGIGVMFSVLFILLYQGGLTLAAGLIAESLTEVTLAEISGYGGILVIMIGLNLLGLQKLKTANYLPGLVIIFLLAAAHPFTAAWFAGLNLPFTN